MEFPSDSGYRRKEPKAARGRQVTLITEKNTLNMTSECVQRDGPGWEPNSGSVLTGNLDVCMRSVMLYLAVSELMKTKPSGGSTEAQCGSQQQRDDRTVILSKQPKIQPKPPAIRPNPRVHCYNCLLLVLWTKFKAECLIQIQLKLCEAAHLA